MNNLKIIFACSALIALSACDMNNNSENSYQDRMDIAAEWVTAGYTGKAEAIEMIETNMSEDGIVVGDRYVGMGFIWNPDESGMTITYIIPDSPASKALQVGDSFVEVAGVRVADGAHAGALPVRAAGGRRSGTGGGGCPQPPRARTDLRGEPKALHASS